MYQTMKIQEFLKNWPIKGLRTGIQNISIPGGLNINHKDKDGQCLLTIAMKNHDYDIAKILVKKPGINLDIIDQNGISFPFILLNSENLELIEQIVKVLKNRIFVIQIPFNLTHVKSCDSSTCF